MPSIRYIVKTDVSETFEIIKAGQVGSNIVFSEVRTFDFGELATLACEKFISALLIVRHFLLRLIIFTEKQK